MVATRDVFSEEEGEFGFLAAGVAAGAGGGKAV